MTSEVLISYIRKLSHPLREIRERALQLLVAKLQLGWELEDELAGTRLLLEAALAWFHVQQPSLQNEALYLLLSTIRTKAGTYIAKEIGIAEILSQLNDLKCKIEPEASEMYDDVLETLRFLNTVQSQENVTVPHLNLPSVTSSEADGESSCGIYNLGPNFQSSNDNSVSNDEIEITRQNTDDGIKILLFPWADLCSSDVKTILLIEDALKLLKSTRRCCRFIRDVFLRDFPPEIFLNRPAIIQNILTIATDTANGKVSEALHCLLSITEALSSRLQQLVSLDLIHEPNKIQSARLTSNEKMNPEVEQFARENGLRIASPEADGLEAMRQLPAPIYALDSMQAVLSSMARSFVLIETHQKEILDLNEFNLCLCLVESLVNLLLEAVREEFWRMEHSTKTHRDIAHKSCMVMRLLGDLLPKYRTSFTTALPRKHHVVAWLRLVDVSERLARWARQSPLPPTSLLMALQSAQLQPSLSMLYPALATRLCNTVQASKISIDKEYKSKYRELTRLTTAMEDVVRFMKNTNSCRNSKKVLKCIKSALPVLELNFSEEFLDGISEILFYRLKDWELTESDWSEARNITLSLMAHNCDWVRGRFYRNFTEMVKKVLMGDNENQIELEKSLALLCDVGVLTEICCHGMCDKLKEVEASSSQLAVFLLRGRRLLSASGWWRLLASLLPVLPTLHAHARHDTEMGRAICKSLESDIAECMGVSRSEVLSGLVRLLFVRCPSVQMDTAHSLCRLMDDPKYLPPTESLRADILISALRRVEPDDFNIDYLKSPSQQTTGLMQILDVLKQDLTFDEEGLCLSDRRLNLEPILEPSLRRATLQQLAVLLQHQQLHETFVQCDGINIVVAILRMSLLVDDYLAFPECGISCVSVLNSICYGSRHALAKIADLPALLLRVILIFPANDSVVQMSAQVLAVTAWAGFILQELDKDRKRVLALPASVIDNIRLPFAAHAYWTTSPNALHSTTEWLLSDEECRSAVRVRWSAAWLGAGWLHGAAPPGPLTLRPAPRDVIGAQTACPLRSAATLLMALQNAVEHSQVRSALQLMQSYTYLIPAACIDLSELASLPWSTTLARYLSAAPASPRDITLLITLLKFVIAYLDNVPSEGGAKSWIKSAFIDGSASMISLLSRDQLFPQQSAQDNIEVTQLKIYIVKLILRCVSTQPGGEQDSSKIESLLKILLACLQRVDLRNFHMLGYLNELMHCIRFTVNSPYCQLSEDTILDCMRLITQTLSGCAAGGGRKGQGCRLDALLTLLALLSSGHHTRLPPQRWSEFWSGGVLSAVTSRGFTDVLFRAASLHVLSALAQHATLLPHISNAVPDASLCEYAARVFCTTGESNAVRTAAASLLTSLCARPSPQTEVHQNDMLEKLHDNGFAEHCLEILVDFCSDHEYKDQLEPNVPLSILERRSELEVRAQKFSDLRISPAYVTLKGRPPPTAALVEAIADALYNLSGYKQCPLQAWNEQGLFRMLFRCVSWTNGTCYEVAVVRSSICRALCRAAMDCKSVRLALANTKDCLHHLLTTFEPVDEDDCDTSTLSAHSQALLLLATLLTERGASDSVWTDLRDRRAVPFFTLLLQCLDSEDVEFRDAGLYCLTQLAHSAKNKKYPDKTSDRSWIDLLDHTKSPHFDQVPMNSGRRGQGDWNYDDCHPEYVIEDICKSLMFLHQRFMTEKQYMSSQDDAWTRVSSCLSSVLSVSSRARSFAVHRELPKVLLAALQAVRDHLSVVGKPTDVIKNANNNPVLRTLYWLLTLTSCLMTECPSAKESFADNSIAASLNRLWPWCMMTEQLRDAVVRLLLIFSNNCPKAWSSMCSCVGGRSLVLEVSTLAARAAAQWSRPHDTTLLPDTISTLAHCAAHAHCRSLVLQSGILSCVYKLRLAERARCDRGAVGAWSRLAEALSRHADGAAGLLELRPILAALAVKAHLMPAVAHAAHFHRNMFLQAPDLLELLSGSLLAGDTSEVASAARAVWALAANNHKAKLSLRSAGISAAVHSAMERLQRARRGAAADRALQLLIYTNSVLQTT